MAADGAFGVALMDFADNTAVRSFIEEDPTVRAGLMRYELWPMRITGAQAARPTAP